MSFVQTSRGKASCKCNAGYGYRAIVDIVAHNNIGSNIQLSKNERREIVHVLHNACMIDGAKVSITGELMKSNLKQVL